MASSLSVYWVKFFKGAGFPQDVATKHAVVFSNNRIKPDMLPDLDKPSLKEMGITLMGDMIAILRYAKKVVEETTCERFLVDSEGSCETAKASKPVAKKVVSKTVGKAISAKTKSDTVDTAKLTKSTTPVIKSVSIKKALPARSVIPNEDIKKRQLSLKRKLDEEHLVEEEFKTGNNDKWNPMIKKKVKILSDTDEDKVEYKVILPKGSTVKSQQLLKKTGEQKRTVFDRLGDSSVTSTTNLNEGSPTFNITGLGKDVLKRSVSVFNRLGDKDTKRDTLSHAGILKNGTSSNPSQGILKKWSPSIESPVVTKKIVTKPVGTMHADHEASMKGSNGVKQLVKTTKKLTFTDTARGTVKATRSEALSGKLASERLSSIPAKARLGLTGTNSAKQVTFNRIATVTHVKRPDVFSRLGI